MKIQKGHGFGAEELAFWLNRYFELLVKHISKAGGDVLKFAGDAILVLWPPRRKVGNEMRDIPLKTRAHAAAKCGLVGVEGSLGWRVRGRRSESVY